MDRHFAPRIYVLHRYVSPRNKEHRKKKHPVLLFISRLYRSFRKKDLVIRIVQFLLIIFAAWNVFVLFSLIFAVFTKQITYQRPFGGAWGQWVIVCFHPPPAPPIEGGEIIHLTL